MTFSLVARDPGTGALGLATSTSALAVGARCLHLRSGVGAVASQNITDPLLGGRLLDLLESGASAEQALEIVTNDDEHIAYRQIAVIDRLGRSATYSGAEALGCYAQRPKHDLAAVGNLLAGEAVVDALVGAFEECTSEVLEERLLAALEGALAAGGEVESLRSAALKVVDAHPWPVTDLRVDCAAAPLLELRRLWEHWAEQKDDYARWVCEPETYAATPTGRL